MKKLVGIVVLMAAGGSFAAQQGTASSARETALAYWTSSYAGAEVAGAVCAPPRLPTEPRSYVAERTAKAIRTWQQCHRRLMGALAPEAAQKAIPAEALAAMTPAERDAATRHVATVHAKLADARQADAATVIAAQQAWREQARRYRDDYVDRFSHSRDRHESGQQDVARQKELARRP